MTDTLVYRLLYLVSVFGAGNERIWELYGRLGSFENICTALRSDRAADYFTPNEIKLSSRIKKTQLDSVIEHCEKSGTGILCYGEKGYPERLLSIPNPPVLLFYRGNADILNSSYVVAVVGARNISDYSTKITEHIASVLASNGVAVASGFAAGTDITAHLAAVRNGGKTIAVLGCGTDYNYPAQNIQYRDEILENGVFVSEHFPRTSAQLKNFTARNRILTGLSLGTAVIEAGEKSGSLNSADHSLAQGRDLWAVPVHDITDHRYDGNKKLLREGASAIYEPEDILREYFENIHHKQIGNTASDAVALNEKHTVRKSQSVPKKKAVPEKKPAEQSVKAVPPSLNDDEKIVYDILRKAEYPLSADEIVTISNSDIFTILSIITNLEISGVIKSDEGQTYYLK